MAVHARLRRRDVRERRLFDTRVAVAAVDPHRADVVLVGELDGLNPRHALLRDVGRPVHGVEEPEKQRDEENETEHGHTRDGVRAAVEDLHGDSWWQYISSPRAAGSWTRGHRISCRRSFPMKRPVLLVAAFLLASAALAAAIPELFQKTKEQVKAGSWSDALSTMSALESEASQPGNEKFQKQLQAPLAFYRGVCQANLGQAEQARASFQTFLADQPNASMDPAMYSKRAVASFEDARRSTAAPAVKAGGSPSLFNSFQEFKA